VEAININVNKQIDGYTFSMLPSIREKITSLFPDARPANLIFVGFDTNSNLDDHIDKLESYIYPALLGVQTQIELQQKVNLITFTDTNSGAIIQTYKFSA
jgi:hypothetical protein